MKWQRSYNQRSFDTSVDSYNNQLMYYNKADHNDADTDTEVSASLDFDEDASLGAIFHDAIDEASQFGLLTLTPIEEEDDEDEGDDDWDEDDNEDEDDSDSTSSDSSSSSASLLSLVDEQRSAISSTPIHSTTTILYRPIRMPIQVPKETNLDEQKESQKDKTVSKRRKRRLRVTGLTRKNAARLISYRQFSAGTHNKSETDVKPSGKCTSSATAIVIPRKGKQVTKNPRTMGSTNQNRTEQSVEVKRLPTVSILKNHSTFNEHASKCMTPQQDLKGERILVKPVKDNEDTLSLKSIEKSLKRLVSFEDDDRSKAESSRKQDSICDTKSTTSSKRLVSFEDEISHTGVSIKSEETAKMRKDATRNASNEGTKKEKEAQIDQSQAKGEEGSTFNGTIGSAIMKMVSFDDSQTAFSIQHQVSTDTTKKDNSTAFRKDEDITTEKENNIVSYVHSHEDKNEAVNQLQSTSVSSRGMLWILSLRRSKKKKINKRSKTKKYHSSLMIFRKTKKVSQRSNTDHTDHENAGVEMSFEETASKRSIDETGSKQSTDETASKRSIVSRKSVGEKEDDERSVSSILSALSFFSGFLSLRRSGSSKKKKKNTVAETKADIGKSSRTKSMGIFRRILQKHKVSIMKFHTKEIVDDDFSTATTPSDLDIENDIIADDETITATTTDKVTTSNTTTTGNIQPEGLLVTAFLEYINLDDSLFFKYFSCASGCNSRYNNNNVDDVTVPDKCLPLALEQEEESGATTKVMEEKHEDAIGSESNEEEEEVENDRELKLKEDKDVAIDSILTNVQGATAAIAPATTDYSRQASF